MDESARRLSHEELAVASLLAGEGHDVRSVAESRDGGRHADLSVGGSSVEVKSFAPLSARRQEPGARSVYNKLADAAGQAPHVIFVGGGSGLAPATIKRGLARYAAAAGTEGALRSLRAVGEGYDLTWTRLPARQVGRGAASERLDSPPSPRAPRERGWGLAL